MAPKRQDNFGRAGTGIEGKGDEKQKWKQSPHAQLSHLLTICASEHYLSIKSFTVLDSL